MPLSYMVPRVPGGHNRISSAFYLSFPVDWYAAAAVEPLPVFLLLHGGGGDALSFMREKVQIQGMWDGTLHHAMTRIKAVAIAPEGVSVEGEGGDWNSGHLGRALRGGRVDDVAFVFDALDRADRALTEHFNAEYGPQMGVTILHALDRSRLFVIGFSNGAEMTLRIAWESKNGAWGWTVPAIRVAAATIGGWDSLRSFDNVDAADADWTPLAGQFVSVLHFHGEQDDDIKLFHPGGLDETEPVVSKHNYDATDSQVAGDPNDYARADFTGEGTRLKLRAVAETDYAGTLIAGAPLAGLPMRVTVVAEEWTAATGQVALHLYHDPNMAHEYPNGGALGYHATTHFIEFFERFGQL